MLTYTAVLLVLAQTFSLPLTLAWFYTNRAELAATKCINVMEPVKLCSGKCYLREIVVTRLHPADEQDRSTTPPTLELRPVVMIAPAPAFSPAPPPAATRRRPATPADHHLVRADRGFTGSVFQPPRA
ncbi:MAG: hypothetical protein WBA17_11610 [Saprospiraceae bacterium]